ncbi:MAG: hypothetical protein LBK95_06080 [Bifidobacteriaceae bacterium]|nr:hypothetical protein [Bifidobacteriaceae bacterium]
MQALVKWALAIALATAGALVFGLYQTRDESLPYGTRTVLIVESFGADMSKAEFIQTVQQTAQDRGINIYKLVADPNDFEHGRMLYAAVGDQADYQTHTKDGRYPDFAAGFNTTLRPLAELGDHDARGQYFLNAAAAVAATVAGDWAHAGIGVHQESLGFERIAAWILAGSQLVVPAAVALIGLALVITFSTALASKGRALAAIHGRSRWQVFGSAILHLTNSFAIAAGAILALGLGALWFVNRWRQLWPFAVWFAWAAAAVYIVAVSCLVAALASQGQLNLAPAIKGQLPVALLVTVAAAAQVLTLLLAFTVIGSVVRRNEILQQQQAASTAWAENSELVSIRFSGTMTEDDFERAIPPFRQIVGALASDDRVVLAEHETRVPNTGAFWPGVGNTLVVNDEFLRRVDVLDETGALVSADAGPGNAGHIRLLIPADQAGESQSIMAGTEAWANAQQSRLDEERGATAGERQPLERFIDIVFVRNDQDVFNFGSTWDMEAVAQRSPVVVVVPTVSENLSGDFLISVATGGSLLFEPADDLHERLIQAGVGQFVMTIDRAADLALEEMTENARSIKRGMLTIAATVLVLFLASLVLAVAYSNRKHRELFVEHLHGHTWIRRNRRFLGAVAGASLVVLTASTLAGRIATPVGWSMALVVVAVNAGITAAVLGVVQRRFRADHIKRV